MSSGSTKPVEFQFFFGTHRDLEETTDAFIFPQVNIHLREHLPSHKLAWGRIYSLACKLECPFMFSLGSQEFALDVEESIRLVGFVHRVVHDLYRLHLFVFKEFL